MNSLRQGAFRIFRFKGIDVFLHWSWFLVAAYEINARESTYSSVAWNVLEYLALFLIVTVHEFGHALACRQVGGQANQIVLWPLGGVAYVDPPQRPGATLWSIAAGPLVNVLLFPILYALYSLANSAGMADTNPDLHAFLHTVLWIDAGLLIFNILPIYPLDGGQIVRSLLWFVVGRAQSLFIATILGFIGMAAFIFVALREQSVWFGILAVFILMNSWSGLQHARALLRFAKLPRHNGLSCPSCKASPPIGNLWVCGQCGASFDIFQTDGRCPNCAILYSTVRCLDCGVSSPVNAWTPAILVEPIG